MHHSICLRNDIAGIDDGSFPQVFCKLLIQNINYSSFIIESKQD